MKQRTGAEHGCTLFCLTSVQVSPEGSDGGADARVDVRHGGGRHSGRERGCGKVVLGVQYVARVHDLVVQSVGGFRCLEEQLEESLTQGVRWVKVFPGFDAMAVITATGRDTCILVNRSRKSPSSSPGEEGGNRSQTGGVLGAQLTLVRFSPRSRASGASKGSWVRTPPSASPRCAGRPRGP